MNVLVTAGGTLAPVDEVRQLTNTSTGRLGAGIAEAALQRGATVVYLHAPAALRPFDLARRVDLDADPVREATRIRSVQARWREIRPRYYPMPIATGTMPEYAARLRALLATVRFDVAFLAMAAADYAPDPTPGKLASTADELVIRCRRLPKLIASVRDQAPHLYLVGFKLTAGQPIAELIRQANQANQANRADLTVANDLATVRAGRHQIHLVRPGQPVESFGPPDPIADRLVDRVLAWSSARVATHARDESTAIGFV